MKTADIRINHYSSRTTLREWEREREDERMGEINYRTTFPCDADEASDINDDNIDIGKSKDWPI